jgi:MFS family permease
VDTSETASLPAHLMPARSPDAVPRRRTLPPGAAFAVAALTLAALYLAAGAPTPLLVVFQQEWGFAPWVLTVAFGTYAIGLLAALLVAGQLSDYVGRRPVLAVALTVGLLAMLMFLFAPGIGWVIAARAVQGIATGAATSAFTASIVEQAPVHRKRLGTIIGSVAPAGGLGLGALLTGVAVQVTRHASLIVFAALAVIMAVGAVLTALSAETAAPRPGAAGSLVPHVVVPPAARREFTAAVPVHLAAWMLSGLFLGLVPTIIQDLFGLHSGLLNGATAFVLPETAAVAGFFLGRFTPRRTTVIGGVSVLTGTALIVGGVAAGILPLLWLGGLIGGVGFGASFSGALRAITPLAEMHQRAGLFAAVYIVAYLSYGVPAIIAGLLVAPVGLLATVLGYSVAIILAASAGLAAQLRNTQNQPGSAASPSGLSLGEDRAE